ncbi:MAG TPA: DUF6178 family protein [Polyangiaceae bacterium]|nr:DUF6178 family protein [Polyangiaceae bacterium]
MPKLRAYRPPSSLRLLEHVLDRPGLVAAVRELSPPALGRLVDHIGLEDAAELVALATTAQLQGVFDEDLWRADAAGDDPRFDPARFGLWLEVLLEAGEKVVVDRLCELPLDFVILAVARLVLVVDMDELGRELSEDEETLELTEKALDSTAAEEWEEFRMISRDPRTWDAVLAALLALDREHHDLLRRILERVAAVSSEYIADNGGLYDVLTSDEMLESDARAERDDRRAARGYVAPSDARSFLALARQGLDEDAERDPVTRAYFRELEPKPATPPQATKPRGRPKPATADVARLTRLLDEAVAASEPSRPPTQRALAVADHGSLLGVALVRLGEESPLVHAERAEELAYLTNVLVAGDSTKDGRTFRPVEALERAIALCNLGLDHELDQSAPKTGTKQARETASARADRAKKLLETTHLDRLFRIGLRRRET